MKKYLPDDFDFERELEKIDARRIGINTESRIFDPKADVVFKAIFAQNTKESEIARKSLLSSILGKEVLVANLIRNELAATSEEEKESRFDLFVRLETDEEVNVEIQLKNVDDMQSRSEYYVCRIFAGQKAKGLKYAELHKACQISILNFTLFADSESFMDEYMYRNAAGNVLSGNTKIIFVELGKINKLANKPIEQMTGAEKWSLFLRYANDKRQKDLMEKIERETEGIAMAAGILNTVSESRAMQLAYLGQLMRETDEISRHLSAKDEGFSHGRAEGLSIGKAEGISLGKAESMRAMAKHLPIEQISSILDIPEDEVRKAIVG